ncbi:Uncharacterised protein [Bordetella pertussis]|nr:Uncharacterised protein [Bordetella pertussis]CPO33443.1 Uncharacterised protein [Bordetella pertussis]
MFHNPGSGACAGEPCAGKDLALIYSTLPSGLNCQPSANPAATSMIFSCSSNTIRVT